MPVVATGGAFFGVHALLDNGPLAGLVDDEGVQVELESVGDGVVVDTGGEAAGAGEVVAVEACARREGAEFVGGAGGVASPSAADGEAEVGEVRVESALEGSHDGGGDAGGVPVHAHDAAERLEPEGIAEATEESGGAVGEDDVLGDRCAELGHALGQPGGDASTVEGEIGCAGAVHGSIVAGDRV